MSTPRQRSSSISSPSAKHNGKAAATPAVPPQRPAPLRASDDRDGWRAQWQAQGQPWRTEPEIDQKRQAELDRYRAIVPDIEKGIYPFGGMKLSRADVEWLLATHEHGRGPVDWSDEKQRQRKGLDMRGANLSQIDLQRLPLACLQGGLDGNEWMKTSREQRDMAKIHLENTNLTSRHLEGSFLAGAYLEGANLSRSHLEKADLFSTHLEKAYLLAAHVEGASLRSCFFDIATVLDHMILGNEEFGAVLLSDIHWGGANVSVMNWERVKMLGDEQEARQSTMWFGHKKDQAERLRGYWKAIRASRQLALVLQNQGLNQSAGRLAYRAQILERQISGLQTIQYQMKLGERLQALGAWLFSWFLFLIAGYGYKPGRSFLTYFLVISGFATAYYFLGHTIGPTLTPLGAFVFSMTSFHGRGFFPGNNISLDDPLTVLAAFEALVGLIIEVTFIATLTQRFFNR